MATWTTIADARLEPDKPARSIDAIALRDNPVAIAENAPNAPKVNQYYLLITTSTTWTVPKTGQYQIDIVGGGSDGTAGAGGAGAGGAGGAGGAAGDSIRLELSLTQGDTYPLVIGALGGASSGFGVTMRGNARRGEFGGGNIGGNGGFGGVGAQPTFSATTAVVATAGGNGGSGAFSGGVGGVGGGVYGGGGGGGGGGGSAPPSAGGAAGAGAQGAVIIRGI